jgi:hypothetical protein
MSENQKNFMNDFHELCKKYSINGVVIEQDMDDNPIIAFYSNGESFYFKNYVSLVSTDKEAAFYNIQHRVSRYYIDSCGEEKEEK